MVVTPFHWRICLEEMKPKMEREQIRPRGGVPSGQDGSGEVVAVLAAAVCGEGVGGGRGD